MKSLVISLAVGASALFVTAASAAPLSADVLVGPDSNIQNVRLICRENGRCWREHSERRVIIREPRESYGYERGHRGYYNHHERRGGVNIEVPGVSVGVGTRRY
jgi:hypothetical protein